MPSVHCSIAQPAALRLFASEGRNLSKLTVLGFLPLTADVSVILRHGRLHIGLGFYFFKFYSSRFVVFRLNRLTCGRISYSLGMVVLVCREVKAGASIYTNARLGCSGPMQIQSLTKLLPLP